MNLLHDVDKPGSDIEVYIKSLDTILVRKMNMIHGMRDQLSKFYEHIKEEQKLSSLFHEVQNQGDGEPVNDIDDPNNEQLKTGATIVNMEDNLLEDDDMLMDDLRDELGAFKIANN